MNGDLKRVLEEQCRQMGIPLMGIAGVDRWEDTTLAAGIPPEFYPQSIYPDVRSVIVIGLPVQLPVLETSPSIWYRELYNTVNLLLDQYTYRLSLFLTEQGFPSVSVPRDGYGGLEALKKNPVTFFSHRHAAYLAGLGTFGINNMLLTSQYGPRVRFGSIFTEADLPSNPLLNDELCTGCLQCVRCCPAHALGEGGYPEVLTDKEACLLYSAELNRQGISPCGICIRVCPVGEDRSRFHRKDPSLYEDPTAHEAYQRAWKHVRNYGHR
ncbi:MAG: epoxyqueuosine reductase [Methanomicrobiales archaeon]|nr:epoxyqueuosine reductase [Methanomicrobiales archaeon]MDD1679872.1 epoxyqueuosine reductase [Methanomicrobiales archaeon]